MFAAMRRIISFFRRDRLDDDVAEEIQLHLSLRTQSLIDQGMTAQDAARAAQRQFGNVVLIRERAREQWGGSTMDMLIQDIRYGFRLIRKAPGFTAVAVASLAAGIGFSTVLFSVVNSMVFRPVHADRPEEIVQVFTSDFDGPPHLYGGSSYADYRDFQEAGVFDSLLASMQTTATLGDDERPEVVDGLLVSPNYFDVLGLRPSLGRFFQTQEADAGAPPAVVLSHGAWRHRFDTDPSIVGRTVELNGRPFTVIGVGPVKFTGTSIERAFDFFAPVAMQQVLAPEDSVFDGRGARQFRLLGRLREGVTPEGATARLRVTAAALLEQDPQAWRDRTGRGRVVTVLPEVSARFVGAGPGTVFAMVSGVMAGVAALLLIACINVATVLLARATTRRREIAVRLAMGASRRRVVRQLLTECAILAAAGGASGLLLAQGAAALFLRFRPEGVPPFDLTLDSRILWFSVAASLVAVVLFGLAPALQTTRPDVNAELKGGTRAVARRRWRFNLRSGLVVSQVAVSLALLAGSALMFRSARAGETDDPGFRRQDVINVGIDLSGVADRERAHGRVYDAAVDAVAAVPGVERVALAALIPQDGSNMQTAIQIAGEAAPHSVSPDINIVGPGYFALLEIPVTQGREFSQEDRGSAPLVALVNEAMARQYWNGAPVGKTFVMETSGDHVQIVGVVGDLRHRSFGDAPRPMVYFSAHQRARPRMTLHVRSAMALAVLAPTLHRTLHETNRAAGLSRAETMREYFARVTMPQRLGAAAALAIAGVELTLAIMALYGVITFAAAQRRREIGLRVALGASHRSVIGLIMREGLVLTSVGAVVGVGIALLGGAALRSELIGVGPADPLSVGGSVLVLLVVGAAASYVPARLALRADPSSALRSE